MENTYKTLLNQLLDLELEAFSKCADERKRLHDVEWENRADSKSSVLGEVEIAANDIRGVAKNCVSGKPENVSHVIEALEAIAIFKNKVIANWIAFESGKSPKFFQCLLTIESLRACSIAMLQNLTRS